MPRSLRSGCASETTATLEKTTVMKRKSTKAQDFHCDASLGSKTTEVHPKKKNKFTATASHRHRKRKPQRSSNDATVNTCLTKIQATHSLEAVALLLSNLGTQARVRGQRKKLERTAAARSKGCGLVGGNIFASKVIGRQGGAGANNKHGINCVPY